MAYNTRKLLRDQGEVPVPQYFNSDTDSYELIKGSNGASNVQLTGSKLKEDVLQNAANTIGIGKVFDVTGFSMASFQVIGTFAGTVTFEASNDGTNWFPIKVFPVSGDPGAITATTPGLFQTSVAAIKSVRANITTYTSGTITVICVASVVG